VVDAETISYMVRPRCGLPDVTDGSMSTNRRKRYALQGSSYQPGSTLSYRINQYSAKMPPPLQDQIFQMAFKFWSRATNIKFRQVKETAIEVDIDIMFERILDGPGGTVAYALYPNFGGDQYYDEDENWTHNSRQGENLLETVTHEIGHTLGLHHSSDRAAVMWPYTRPYSDKFALAPDDIKGIKSIYGSHPSGDLSLVDGPALHKGRIEIHHNNQWNAICDDEWDDIDATVACRQLGYRFGVARQGDFFPRGQGVIAMDNVNCTGKEVRLMNCSFNGWNNHDCRHSEDAGVECRGRLKNKIFSV